ncbi:MAG: hypothetical protein WAV85_19120, partial [Rhodoferax sp.]
MSLSPPPNASNAAATDAPKRSQGFSPERRRALYAGVAAAASASGAAWAWWKFRPHSVAQGAE